MHVTSRVSTALILALCVMLPAAGSQAASGPDDQVSVDVLSKARPRTTSFAPASKVSANAAAAARTIPGIDSLLNFTGSFRIAGFDPHGQPQSVWHTETVGRRPGEAGDVGGRTFIRAPVIPVALDLRNLDGSPRYVNGNRLYYDPTPYIAPTLNSPVFQNHTYSSSPTPTQFSDAIQRAEYFNQMDDAWHTLLKPALKTTRVMVLIAGTYLYALNADGTCCRFVLVDEFAFLNALFPGLTVDNTTVIGAAELAGDMTTKDMTTLLFPNTFLYNGDPNNCCVLGFHSYDVEPGDASNGNRERRYVMNYSSWISPGLFGDPASLATFQDVTALSHEIAETYNDPFVNNTTPWWLAPNGLCQDNLETGDVIEGLPKMAFAITMNGMTYHPQNEALLQWFESVNKSDALHGAFSYPDESVLKSANVSQKFNCGR